MPKPPTRPSPTPPTRARPPPPRPTTTHDAAPPGQPAATQTHRSSQTSWDASLLQSRRVLQRMLTGPGRGENPARPYTGHTGGPPGVAAGQGRQPALSPRRLDGLDR